MAAYRRLLIAATLLALAVIALGAYVRLSDAGLGCPDWPGCYGHLIGLPEAGHEQQAAQAAYPERPLDAAKAGKEMLHRYLAGTLGLLILAIAGLAWKKALRQRQSPALPTLLLGVVGLQALLGMWTVTLLLKPLTVTLHLIGGMTTLSLLVALVFREFRPPAPAAAPPGLRLLAAGALLAVIAQIALGGWVSSNYAALACPDFPQCQGQWRPAMDFAEGFSMHRELGLNAAGAALSGEALTAIHWAHRVGALIVALVTGGLAGRLLLSGERRWRAWGATVAGLLLTQLGLGVANVLLALPLALAVLHNVGAALLLTAMVAVNVALQRRPAALPSPSGVAQQAA